jgi:oxygen-independent coproporphyrinogen-3 oxidase
VAPSSRAHEAFVEALCAEVRRRAGEHPDTPVETIYLGGGTPSRLGAAHLERLFAALRDTFDCTEVREVTVEANPDDLNAAFLQALGDLGVNRLSLGVQSFAKDDLRFLGRRHDAAQAARAVPLARAAGFENISVDLIFGLPDQTPARWQATLEKTVEQAPQHVTLYRLTAEAGTPLGRRVADGRVRLPNANTTAAQYQQALDMLGERLDAGYRLYEQTHLARPGFEAIHTPRYWCHAAVLGLGPGAHSFRWTSDRAALRRANASDWRAYAAALHSGDAPPHTSETLPAAALADEYVALRLRTARGLSLERLSARYGRDLRTERGAVLDRLCAEGYATLRDDRLRLTRAGRLRLDALTAALV